MADKQTILNSILTQGMLPLYFYEDADVSLKIAETLYRAGVRVIEYTNRGPAALANFRHLVSMRHEMPDMYFGIGTIKTLKDAQDFIDAGADFLVAPIVNPEVGDVARRHNMLWIPGCMTPTEIFTAQQYGAALIKIFPANILGPAFISSIKELFGGQLFMPTGGVELDQANIDEWFKAGVCAVGMGSKLISKKVLQEQLYHQLYNHTLIALELVKNH